MAEVVNSINRFKKKPVPKSRLKLLTDFFTRKSVYLPNIDHFFKFNLNEQVQVDLSTHERRDFSHKWSLHPGEKGGGGYIFLCVYGGGGGKLHHPPQPLH